MKRAFSVLTVVLLVACASREEVPPKPTPAVVDSHTVVLAVTGLG